MNRIIRWVARHLPPSPPDAEPEFAEHEAAREDAFRFADRLLGEIHHLTATAERVRIQPSEERRR